MAKPKSTTSKKDYRKPRMVTLSDGSVVQERYVNDYGAKQVYQKPDKDPEAVPPPKDKFAKMKYPPPKRNPVFRKKWASFIGSITGRESFKEVHLDILEVLCDLYVEYVDLEKIIRTEGRTYKSITRFGESVHMHPAVGQLDKVRANIRQYTQKLDLFPKKDNGTESEGEDDEWK